MLNYAYGIRGFVPVVVNRVVHVHKIVVKRLRVGGT